MSEEVMVIGGGVAGIQAALDLADMGLQVHLVEQSPGIGGRMAQLDKTFPTNDCSLCILSPKMADVARHPNIDLLTYSQVERVNGQAGSFKVTVKKKPRYIDVSKCTGCGLCTEKCLVRNRVYLDGAKRPTTGQSEIEEILEKYHHQPQFIISILQEIQAQKNYLPRESLEYVSEKLETPLSKIYKLATFYKSFSLTPRGTHLISVCTGTACHVRGSLKIKEELERKLGIEGGGTTKDLLFTLETVNCLGACALGPLMVVDGQYFGKMRPNKVEKVLRVYRNKER